MQKLIMVEIKEDDFKERIDELRKFRQEQINNLEKRGSLTDFEKSLLETFKKELSQPRLDDELIRDNYYLLMSEIDYWIDMPKEYKNIVTLWIIGTHLQPYMDSFPELFINAMRGSGKSRLLKLINSVAWNSHYVTSITESSLFRTNGTLIIDECESIGSKEKIALRELLNASYKKGVQIIRMKQVKSLGTTEQKAEFFNLYRPIAMANIWGMDEVLGDRCISIILEKSNDLIKTRIIENFEDRENIKTIRNQFFLVQLCSLVQIMSLKRTIEDWNNYIIIRNNKLHNYIYTYNNTNNTNYNTNIKRDIFFNKIFDSEINGRNLELFMPLFLIANLIGDDVFNFTLETAKNLVYEKKNDEVNESKDVMLFDYISKLSIMDSDFVPIKQFTIDFKNYTNENAEWLNEKWIGRALKRLRLITQKRRVAQGNEVILNISKAKEKMKIFKTSPEKDFDKLMGEVLK